MIKVYPSIIHPEEDGGYWIEFPDLEGCQTQGDTMEELMAMAQEALGLYLASLMERSLELPAPSDIKSIEADGCQTTYVVVDIDNYRRDTRAVKKMVSIPAWLAQEATENNVSLSKVLQDALKERLSVI